MGSVLDVGMAQPQLQPPSVVTSSAHSIASENEGGRSPSGRWERVPGPLLGKATDPLTSCEVEAMAEFMTARLAGLVSARLSDGRPVQSPRKGPPTSRIEPPK